MKELKAEIFAVGKWNGIPVTLGMLNELANNFSRLSEVVDVPLKFGHNEEQDMTDGKPALGWVDKVWVEGQKLFAKFTDIPDVVFDAMSKKLYNNVSIEMFFDVEHKDVKYGTVLTAVALLGADMPAVNTLSDLQTYMTANNLAFSDHATFSKKPINFKSEVSTMTPEEETEMARLKADLKARDKVIAKHADEKVEFTEKITEKDALIKKEKDDAKKATFTNDKETVAGELESLVKGGKITPAQRDALVKDLDENTIAKVKFTIDTLKNNVELDLSKEQGKRKKKDEGSDDLSSDEQVIAKANKFIADTGGTVTFSAAVQHVLRSDKELAREYADMNDKEVA